MWAAMVVVMASAPPSASLGSVDGSWVWLESRTSAAAFNFVSGSGDLGIPWFASGGTILERARVLLARGIAVGQHRVVAGASLDAVEAMAQPELPDLRSRGGSLGLTPAIATLFTHQDWTFRARVSIPFHSGKPWTAALEPSLHARVRLANVSLGAELGGSHSPLDPRPTSFATSAPCGTDETRCSEAVLVLSTGWLRLLASWTFDENISLGAIARLDLKDELVPMLLGSSNVPDAPRHFPRWLRLTERLELTFTWAPAPSIGATLGVGVGLEQRAGDVVTSATTGWLSLTLWVRTDRALQRMWLDL
jgi:hypothetical protein